MTSNTTREHSIGVRDEDAPEWITATCVFCESNGDAVVKFPRSFALDNLSPKTFSARRETEHYHYRILECQKCGSVFSSPVLAPARLAELYRGSKLTYTAELETIASTYIRYLRRGQKWLAGKDSALEIGCGNGFFLRALAQFGFRQVAGVEPSEDAVARAGDLKRRIFCGFFEDAPFEPDSFDLICCFQTLDHVIHPLEALHKCRRLLRPGGLLYLVVHNEQAMQARWFGEKSPIYDVEHVYLFNPVTLSLICEKAGFKSIRVFGVCNTYPLEYWVRMAPIPAKRFVHKTSQVLGLARLPITIPAGNLGIFAQRPPG